MRLPVRHLAGSAILVFCSAFAVVGCTSSSSSSSSSSSGNNGGSSSGSSGASSSGSSGASSGGSSGASSGGADAGNIEAEINALCERFGRQFTCEEYCGTTPDPDCLAGVTNGCNQDIPILLPLLDAGIITFDPAKADNCITLYQNYFSILAPFNCSTDGGFGVAAYYDLVFGQRSCVGGRSVFDGGIGNVFTDETFADCDDFLSGTVAQGGMCAESDECMEGTCEGPDGGCGTCAPADAGTPAPDGGEGCVVHEGDGGYTNFCDPGTLCDEVAEICLPLRGQGETCGDGIGHCSGACGFRCDPDGGTCVPHVTTGTPCQDYVAGCAPGATCVFSMDGGYCHPNAMSTERCGVGANFDEYGQLYAFAADTLYSGYAINGPGCAPGLVCDPGDGGTVGTCRALGARASGQTCGNTLLSEDTCAAGTTCRSTGNFESRCQTALPQDALCDGDRDCEATLRCEDTDAGSRCTPKPAVGSGCSDDVECAAGLRCVPGDGGQICATPVAQGGSCTTTEECLGDYVECFHRVCTRTQDIVQDPVPYCH